MKNILVIPHVGSAYGHLIRTAEVVEHYFNKDANVTIVLPRHAIGNCGNHIPSNVTIYQRQVNYSICNRTGLLDIDNYRRLLHENNNIINVVRPDLIIGDPGIQASILSHKFQLPWIGIMHGCYLPMPSINKHIEHNLSELMIKAWHTINVHLDHLISLGTNGAYTKWSDIRSTGTIMIPGNVKQWYGGIGKLIGSELDNIGWLDSLPVDFLITCCSAGTIRPTREFLKRISSHIPSICIAGISASSVRYPEYIRVMGNKTAYESLISNDTIVLTHCGYGTLNSIGKAKRIIMLPGDLDQLCNALTYHVDKGWDIVFDRNWFNTLNAPNPFKRQIYWANISIEQLDNELVVTGVDSINVDAINNVASC